MPRTRHTITGLIEEDTPQSLVDHEFFGQYLEVVDEDAKPLAEGLFRPGTVEDRSENDDRSADETEKAAPKPRASAKSAPKAKDAS